MADEIVRNNEVKHDINNNYSCVECGGWIKFSPTFIIAEAKAGDITEVQKKRIEEWMDGEGFDRASENGYVQLGFSKSRNNYFNLNQIKQMDLLRFGMWICGC